MKARVVLTMEFDIGDGDPEDPPTPEEHLNGGWYDELQSKMDNRLFNYSYAHLLSRSWSVNALE